MKPSLVVVTAEGDENFRQKFATHAWGLRRDMYDFSYLGAGAEAGAEVGGGAAKMLADAAVVIVLLSVDLMVDDRLYAIVNEALAAADRKKVIGVEIREDVGCQRDLCQRLPAVFRYNGRSIDAASDADKAWVSVIQQLRQRLAKR